MQKRFLKDKWKKQSVVHKTKKFVAFAYFKRKILSEFEQVRAGSGKLGQVGASWGAFVESKMKQTRTSSKL